MDESKREIAHSPETLSEMLKGCEDPEATVEQFFAMFKVAVKTNSFKWLKANVPEFLSHRSNCAQFLIDFFSMLSILEARGLVNQMSSLVMDYIAIASKSSSNPNEVSLLSDSVCEQDSDSDFEEENQEEVDLPLPSTVALLRQFRLNEAQIRELMFLGNTLPPFVWCRLCVLFEIELSETEKRQYVTQLVTSQKYRDAVFAAVRFNVAQDFPVESLCLPLIKGNHIDSAFTAVGDNVERQLEFCRLLEAHCDSPNLILRFIKKLNFDPLNFPNTMFMQKSRTLGWLIKENLLEEYALLFLPGDARLQTRCIERLSESKSYVLLKRLFLTGCFDQASLSNDLMLYFESSEMRALEQAQFQKLEESYKVEGELYFAAKPPGGIIFVDSIATCESAQAELLSSRIIGLDSEGAATFLHLSNPIHSDVALLQVSTRNFAYLFDMASEPVRTTIDPTLAAVFTNPAVLKVGYRFDGDMRLLRSSFPAMTCFTEMKSYLELANVQGHLFEIGFHEFRPRSEPLKDFEFDLSVVESSRNQMSSASSAQAAVPRSGKKVDRKMKKDARLKKKKMKQPNPEFTLSESEFPSSPMAIDSSSAVPLPARQKFKGGLGQMCYLALGKPLNKAQQMSNWLRRPLSDAQQQYAALDAYCEILMVDALAPLLSSLDSPQLSSFCNNI